MSKFKFQKIKKLFYLILFLAILGVGYIGVKAAGLIINNYNYSPSSILTFVNTDGSVGSNVVSGEIVKYNMTVSNPHWEAQNIKLKFSLPAGFRFLRMADSNGAVIRTDGLQIGATGPGDIKWDYSAPSGESIISFEIVAP